MRLILLVSLVIACAAASPAFSIVIHDGLLTVPEGSGNFRTRFSVITDTPNSFPNGTCSVIQANCSSLTLYVCEEPKLLESKRIGVFAIAGVLVNLTSGKEQKGSSFGIGPSDTQYGCDFPSMSSGHLLTAGSYSVGWLSELLTVGSETHLEVRLIDRTQAFNPDAKDLVFHNLFSNCNECNATAVLAPHVECLRRKYQEWA